MEGRKNFEKSAWKSLTADFSFDNLCASPNWRHANASNPRLMTNASTIAFVISSGLLLVIAFRQSAAFFSLSFAAVKLSNRSPV